MLPWMSWQVCMVTASVHQACDTRVVVVVDVMSHTGTPCSGFAEHNAKQMASLKSKSSTFRSSAERKRMLDLAALSKSNPKMQSHFWFLESDLKGGTVAKFDRTGKGMCQLLRHLKRFNEVCNWNGLARLASLLLLLRQGSQLSIFHCPSAAQGIYTSKQ